MFKVSRLDLLACTIGDIDKRVLVLRSWAILLRRLYRMQPMREGQIRRYRWNVPKRLPAVPIRNI